MKNKTAGIVLASALTMIFGGFTSMKASAGDGNPLPFSKADHCVKNVLGVVTKEAGKKLNARGKGLYGFTYISFSDELSDIKSFCENRYGGLKVLKNTVRMDQSILANGAIGKTKASYGSVSNIPVILVP